MLYLWMGLLAAGIVLIDQLTKLWVVANIGLGGFLPGFNKVFHLTYYQNDGAAFSMLEGQQWLFAILFVALTAAIIWDFWKKSLPFTTFERWCIAAVWAGGLGNMIDRVRLGYVIDMIEVDFMNFAIFNVADCFITCGCIALMVSLVFFNRNFWKDDKKK